VEEQATDRAHRIGQDKPVFVYKLLTEGTVEEKILALQEKKRKLADSVYGKGKKESGPVFDAETIEALLSGG
jgi:SNF2 family DNA or RNA helicase